MALRQGRPGRSLVARETPWGYLFGTALRRALVPSGPGCASTQQKLADRPRKSIYSRKGRSVAGTQTPL